MCFIFYFFYIIIKMILYYVININIVHIYRIGGMSWTDYFVRGIKYAL